MNLRILLLLVRQKALIFGADCIDIDVYAFG